MTVVPIGTVIEGTTIVIAGGDGLVGTAAPTRRTGIRESVTPVGTVPAHCGPTTVLCGPALRGDRRSERL